MNKNKISLITAIIVGMNAMIGVGITTFPSLISMYVGPAGIISCLISIIFIMCIGLSLSRMAHIYPGEGWNYLYPSRWGGHKAGMFSAISYLLAVVAAMGFLTQQAGIWICSIYPFMCNQYLGLIIIFILMILIIAGAETSSIAQYLIATCVIIPLILAAIFCWDNFNPQLLTPFAPYGIKSILLTSPTILFAFGGFESIISLYSILNNPQKNISKAFILAIGAVGLLYIFCFFGILFAIPSKFFSGGLANPLSNILAEFFPQHPVVSKLVLFGAVFAIIGTLHSMIWSLSTLLTSVLHKTKSNFMQNIVVKKIWNSKLSVILTTLAIGLTSLTFKGEALPSLTSFFIVLTFVLSILGLLFIKKEWKSKHNIITLIGLMGGIMMVYFAVQKIILTFF